MFIIDSSVWMISVNEYGSLLPQRILKGLGNEIVVSTTKIVFRFEFIHVSNFTF